MWVRYRVKGHFTPAWWAESDYVPFPGDFVAPNGRMLDHVEAMREGGSILDFVVLRRTFHLPAGGTHARQLVCHILLGPPGPPITEVLTDDDDS